MPGSEVSVLQALNHWILSAIQESSCYYPQFIDGVTEAQRGQINLLKAKQLESDEAQDTIQGLLWP